MVSRLKKTDFGPLAAFLSRLAKLAISSSVTFLSRGLDEGGAMGGWEEDFNRGYAVLGLVYGDERAVAFRGVEIGEDENFRDYVFAFGINV